MFSYQTLMPGGAGTSRGDKPELWLGIANWQGGYCHAPPRPQRGTSPRTTFSDSALDHRSTIRQVWPVESRHQGLLKGASRIGVRDTPFIAMTNERVRWRTRKPFKRIFVPIAHAGWCRHTKI